MKYPILLLLLLSVSLCD
jgi:uncharacterized protein